MRVIFIGGGNIAEAIFARLQDLDIIVIQRNLEKLSNLKTKFPKIQFQNELNFKTLHDDLIFLCIKPQDAKETCINISDFVKNGTIISVMAGISCHSMRKWLNNSNICRAMPNTPSLLGLGVCGVYFTSNISEFAKQQIIDILSRSGKVYPLNHEDQINQITAIAASSPAYVFYFIEALIESAVNQFGFNEELAKDITLQVVRGSLAMIEQNEKISIKQLRENVTSKRGTTAEALEVFERYNLVQIINEAEKACYNRAKELSQTFEDI